MLQIVLGVPGSGKTYRAVDYIYDTFTNEKSSHFGENTHFLTNINQFNFDAFDEGVALPFVYDDFYSKIYQLFTLNQAGANDLELIEAAKPLGLFNCLIVIDEAQNFFDKDEKTLVWWVSYHRHLSQNIILLTQSLDLMNPKYKRFCEVFYVAKSSSLRILKSQFRYNRFIDSKMYQKHLVGTDAIKFKPAVYALYHSGANTQSPKVILKYFGIAVVFLIGFSGAIYLIKSRWSPPETAKTPPVKTSSASQASPTGARPDLNTTALPPVVDVVDVRFLCAKSGLCSYNGFSIDNLTLEGYKKKYDFRLSGVTPFGADFVIYRYKCKKRFLNEVSGSTR